MAQRPRQTRSERCPQTDQRDERTVVPEPLTEAAWSPFGWLPVADVDPRDGKHTMAFEWADAHVNLIGHARSRSPRDAHGLRCEMLFRHDTHTQALMPLNVPAVIAVAPAGVEFTDEAEAEFIRAFRIEPLESLVLHRGTWHWGPFPIEGPEVRLFNVQGSATPRTIVASTWRPRASPSRWICRDREAGGRGSRRVELDDAEEAEVVAATVTELVDAITARQRFGRPREAYLHHDQPEMVGAWPGVRRHGGRPGIERRHADRGAGFEVHSLHGYFLRPTSPGSQTTHVVDIVRDGRSFRTAGRDQQIRGPRDLPRHVFVSRSRGRRRLPASRRPRDPAGRTRSTDSRHPFRSMSESWVRPSSARTAPTGRRAAAGFAPASPCLTTPRCTPACWPTSRT